MGERFDSSIWEDTIAEIPELNDFEDPKHLPKKEVTTYRRDELTDQDPEHPLITHGEEGDEWIIFADPHKPQHLIKEGTIHDWLTIDTAQERYIGNEGLTTSIAITETGLITQFKIYRREDGAIIDLVQAAKRLGFAYKIPTYIHHTFNGITERFDKDEPDNPNYIKAQASSILGVNSVNTIEEIDEPITKSTLSKIFRELQIRANRELSSPERYYHVPLPDPFTHLYLMDQIQDLTREISWIEQHLQSRLLAKKISSETSFTDYIGYYTAVMETFVQLLIQYNQRPDPDLYKELDLFRKVIPLTLVQDRERVLLYYKPFNSLPTDTQQHNKSRHLTFVCNLNDEYPQTSLIANNIVIDEISVETGPECCVPHSPNEPYRFTQAGAIIIDASRYEQALLEIHDAMYGDISMKTSQLAIKYNCPCALPNIERAYCSKEIPNQPFSILLYDNEREGYDVYLLSYQNRSILLEGAPSMIRRHGELVARYKSNVHGKYAAV